MITAITNGIDSHRRMQQAHTVAGVGVVTALVIALFTVNNQASKLLWHFRWFAPLVIGVTAIFWYWVQREDEDHIQLQRALLRRCLKDLGRPPNDAEDLRARQEFNGRAVAYFLVSAVMCVLIVGGACMLEEAGRKGHDGASTGAISERGTAN